METLRLDAQLVGNPTSSSGFPANRRKDCELMADGEIGVGSNNERRNWYCEVEAGEVRLILCDAFGPRWRFTREIDGRWTGHSLLDPTIEAYLAADPSGEASDGARSYVNAQWPGHLSYSSREEAGA